MMYSALRYNARHRQKSVKETVSRKGWRDKCIINLDPY
jgi:hypothetical protein